MYGTVARCRLRPGMEVKLLQLIQEFKQVRIPGLVAQYVYRLDANPQVYYVVILFENKALYTANAASAEQDARYQKLRTLLAADPEWHDGEIVDDFHAS
jgi:hypothetical protein